MNKIFLSNNILYKIYLYYNLFYRYGAFKKKLTYSQNQEDLFINDYFKDLKSGFYIDIGCYHPIRYNNTALLFNRGWRGINIDMNQTSIDLFNLIRKSDINICAAISDTHNEVTQFTDHLFSPINTINKNFSKIISKKLSTKKFLEKKIITYTFDQIIKKNKIEIDIIDFLNIDVESHDFEVLQSIDLLKFKPKIICIEIENSLDNNDKKIKNYLEKYNYYLIKKIGLNGIFENKKIKLSFPYDN